MTIESKMLTRMAINDLLDGLRGVSVPGTSEPCKGLLFADDAVLLCENEGDLGCALLTIREWCEQWKMQVNVGKCGWMSFGGDSHDEPVIKYGEETVPHVHEYVYLGVLF
ncbi:putative LTR retrotransposon, partial [Pseudoloma neurophilia]